MPRVMLLGNLPVAGQYRAPPGRLLRAEPGLYGLGGLGNMDDVCNDPAAMFMQTAGAAFSGASSSGCRTVDGRQADAGWCAASTGVQSANTAFNAACAQARARAAGDPTNSERLASQLEIERLRAQSSLNLAEAAQRARGSATDYRPYIFAGVGLAAVIGAIVIFKKK